MEGHYKTLTIDERVSWLMPAGLRWVERLEDQRIPSWKSSTLSEASYYLYRATLSA